MKNNSQTSASCTHKKSLPTHVTVSAEDKKIVTAWAEALQAGDWQTLAGLLSEKGEFDIQEEKLQVLAVNKSEFLAWLERRCSAEKISQIEYDNCLSCQLGDPVVIFNGGKFPRQPNNLVAYSLHGLRLHIIEGFIDRIAFCYMFGEKPNPMELDRYRPLFDELMKVRGLSFEEAFNYMKATDEFFRREMEKKP